MNDEITTEGIFPKALAGELSITSEYLGSETSRDAFVEFV
jgi:hypothetical protein